jgi:hypothetical protein
MSTSWRSWLAAALGVLGASSSLPLALAQLDLAGIVDVFGIATDAPKGVLVIAGVGGALTLAVVALGLVGAALAAARRPGARLVLAAAAVGGFVTALALWLPAAAAFGAAAWLLEEPPPTRGGPLGAGH